MRPADIHAMSIDQIKDGFIALKKELLNLRFQKANGQLENTARMRQVRRDIARMGTVWAQRTRNGAHSEVRNGT